jgi:uncharacterized protein (TIGR03435 family)
MEQKLAISSFRPILSIFPTRFVAVWLVVVAAVLCGHLYAQTAGATSEDPTQSAFDVVSIRPSKGDGPAIIRPLPDGLHATNVTAGQLIQWADGLSNVETDSVLGLPAWATTRSYDLDAKIIDRKKVQALGAYRADDRVGLLGVMLRNALVERFHLKTHDAVKDVPAYALIVAMHGPKLTPGEPDDPTLPNGALRMTKGQITATGISTTRLAQALERELGAPVVDKTGLTSRYTFSLEWKPDGQEDALSADALGPSIFTAVTEQLGLKLLPMKQPVRVLVVDHIEHPSSN